ncbi:hypothetical protein FBQ82_19450 [Anaerolineae bacterium CFX7]|nr:hypothetical protein [Anaerolineae bacterium CFX7]RIK15676.1 MAG: hypothetical protein DCC52_18455 [Chloroflexota bacterium]
MCEPRLLHSTDMTRPMHCPKNLRNGPCGGARANGQCEIKQEVVCGSADGTRRNNATRRGLAARRTRF